MTSSPQDVWSKWLAAERFGGDEDLKRRVMEHLYSVRDEVLSHAGLREGDVLLDVGAGDGLIGFGALERNTATKVIFSDISEDVLDRARTVAKRANLLERCRFIRAAAEDLAVIEDASVNVVTTRSVLIYVEEKQQAFHEFHRVLKSGGRLSIFEPINRYFRERRDLLAGVDVTPVMEIAEKVRAEYERVHPIETDPLISFDERDLLRCAEAAGFREIHLDLKVSITAHDTPIRWESAVRVRPNPKGLTLEEAMDRALTAHERESLVSHLRPLVENGPKIVRQANVFLRAIRSA